MHAERCPLCMGKGTVPTCFTFKDWKSDPVMLPCRGCKGKGWVSVEGVLAPIAPMLPCYRYTPGERE